MTKRPYWINFADGLPGVCVEELTGYQAMATAEQLTGRVGLSSALLPYPAEPRVGERTDCPSFCFQPAICFGRTSCPRSHACDD